MERRVLQCGKEDVERGGGGGCRRWKDWVAGDGCRKGKDVFGTGVCRRWKDRVAGDGCRKGEGGIWDVRLQEMVVGREGGIWDG
jgi:hypothetical protein